MAFRSPRLDVYVISVGERFTYVVPNFPVFSATLRPIKFTLTDDSTVYDGFINDSGGQLVLIAIYRTEGPIYICCSLHIQLCIIQKVIIYTPLPISDEYLRKLF